MQLRCKFNFIADDNVYSYVALLRCRNKTRKLFIIPSCNSFYFSGKRLSRRSLVSQSLTHSGTGLQSHAGHSRQTGNRKIMGMWKTIRSMQQQKNNNFFCEGRCSKVNHENCLINTSHACYETDACHAAQTGHVMQVMILRQ